MQFIDAVNRILRIEGIIRGDTDPLVTFNDTEHNATSNIAQIAIQTELAELMKNSMLPYEKNETGSITLATGTRTYALAANIVKLYGDPPFFYDTVQNFHIFEYPGGEENLRNAIYTYRTDPGYPNYFYFKEATTNEVSFYPVPNSTYNGTVLVYDYYTSGIVVNSTDTMPFANDYQYYAFCDAAARRFKILFTGETDQAVEKDPNYLSALARLYGLLKPKQKTPFYGRNYESS